MTTKAESIEVELPTDILFAMRAVKKPEDVQKKLKIALALMLFQEQAISLGKASELAGMSRIAFVEVLKDHGIAAYYYSEDDFQRDRESINHFLQATKK